MHALARLIARIGLVGLLAVSLVSTGWSVLHLMRDPLIRPLVDRSAAGFAAAVDRELAAVATPERVQARLSALLDEDPRNWIAIQAVQDVAAERGLSLPPDLSARLQALRDADSGWMARAGRCAECVWDAGSCSLTNAFVCQAPVAITPIGDVAGVAHEGYEWATGGQVDQLNLGLSIVGLAATATLFVSGGSSVTIKAGAGILRMARKMHIVSSRLTRMATEAIVDGIDWARLGGARGLGDWLGLMSDPGVLIRAEKLRPLVATMADLGRIGGRLESSATLHLMRYIDTPDDARRLADATEAMGPKVIGRLEILGKSRFLRAGLHLSQTALALIGGLVGLMLSLATMIGGAIHAAMLRALRRSLRAAAR